MKMREQIYTQMVVALSAQFTGIGDAANEEWAMLCQLAYERAAIACSVLESIGHDTTPMPSTEKEW